jgi:ABC-2 type transport system permease protein
MKMIFRIARMELQKMFYSPIAWLVLIIFGVQSGMQFMQGINEIVKTSELGYAFQAATYGIFSSTRGLFSDILHNLYLYIPLLTMGLLSREFGSGSIKLLYSSPISNKQIVLGKFLSMMVFGLAMISIILITILLGGLTIKDFDFPLAFTGILGLYLVICTYSAIGLFMSSITSYQVVAAIGTFATLFVLGQVDRMWQSIEFVRDITYWLSIRGRCDTFIYGLICSEDFLYFVLVSGLFISFTTFRIKGIREKSPKYVSFIRYVGVFIIIMLIGYTSTIPSLMKYHDSTRTNMNTITKTSQEVISKLKGKVKITTYVNIFDSFFTNGAPDNQKEDMARYKQYSRFYPNIEFEYKYYYDLPVGGNALKSHKRRFEGLTEEQALEKVCQIFDVNSKRFKPGKDYIREMPLKYERNRFVSKITSEGGKIAYLRIYDDFIAFPNESQITAAFKKLVEDLPLVGFVTGHGERNVDDFGSRGYFKLAKEKPFRWSLINNGFDFIACELSRPVDKKISILIIADAKTKFSVQELKNLNDYVDRGGNLIIACDLKRQDNMNPLIERIGVKFLPGQVVEHNKGYCMDLVTAEFTKGGKKIAYQFEEIAQRNQCVAMQGAVAISYKEGNGFKYTPVLVSDTVKDITQIDSVGSWNELKTIDFIDNIAKYDNPKETVGPRTFKFNDNMQIQIDSVDSKSKMKKKDLVNEVRSYDSNEDLGPLTTALALTRKVGAKEQRIMILGDADCFSNSELSRRRDGIEAGNFSMANGMFFWLSDNKVPVDIRRPNPPDDKIYLKKDDMPFFNALYKIVIPSLLALAFLFIWLRRKGR